jgi:hypothetical protein
MEAGTNSSGFAPGSSAASGARSANVTRVVPSTKRAHCAFVTGARSIQKPSTLTR